MNDVREALYFGDVVHKRLRPRTHALRYRVFTVLFDCDRLELLARRVRLFSYNRFNLFSLYDRDHGDGTPLRDYLRRIAQKADGSADISRFLMVCYPRILGYAFNPLTVYFGLDAQNRTRLIIYEVNNTFGQRMTYVLPAESDSSGCVTQSCRKQLYVSPFNTDSGTYTFHVSPIGRDLTIGIALKDDGGALLKAHFRGRRAPLTDGGLLHALAATGWMTVKVTAGIHYEAAKLWIKGLRLRPRPVRADRTIAYVNTPKESV